MLVQEQSPNYFIGFKLGNNLDTEQFIKKLKAVVEQGIAVVGNIPYKHYTFLGIGLGAGGIQHLNSTTVPFTGNPRLDTRAGTIGTLNFLGHEYFHNFNVKRIRPVVLGPFDYDKANLTNMLWVSEGFTSYYEYLMVERAGFMNQDEWLDSLQKDIAAYEGNTDHLFRAHRGRCPFRIYDVSCLALSSSYCCQSPSADWRVILAEFTPPSAL